MKKKLSKMKQQITKRTLILAGFLVVLSILFGIEATSTFYTLRPTSDTKSTRAKATDESKLSDVKALSESPEAAASTAPIASSPSTPPGMKKAPTAQEEKVMQACIQRDGDAYNNYYINFNAELARHQKALAAINAAYDGGYQYKGVFYFDGQAKSLYDADVAKENQQHDQKNAAINSTYQSEKSTSAC